VPWKLWNRKLAETTRGRVVTLLRHSSRTVDELASELELTGNAVRSHLATLERDGLVQQYGARRGGGAGKPATLYGLVPAAEPLLSHAYTPLLLQLLGVLGERLPKPELETVLREVGRRLAAGQPQARGDLRHRVDAAAALLDELGGATEVTGDAGRYEIRGRGCPLSAAVNERPEVCRAVEALVAEATGVPVREHCERGDRPHCRLEVPAAKAGGRTARGSAPEA
jgi:predicted ArsR family transcriptional regulator